MKMTDEEYQRIKEAEKERLRSVRQLKQVQRTLRRQRAVREALEGLAGAQNALSQNADLTDRLAAETARHEARLDLALDSQREEEALSAVEEEAQSRRARALIRQFKQEIGLRPGAASSDATPDPSADAPSSAPASSDSPSPSAGDRPAGDRPDKTIGRM